MAKSEKKLVAKNVEVKVSEETRIIDIYVDADGNLVFEGLGSIIPDWYGETLCMYQVD
jgi:hypothetical protein